MTKYIHINNNRPDGIQTHVTENDLYFMKETGDKFISKGAVRG